MYLDIKLSDEVVEQIGNIVKLEVENQIKNNNELVKHLVKEMLKGQIKTHINNILASNEYREYLRDKLVEYLKNE